MLSAIQNTIDQAALSAGLQVIIKKEKPMNVS